LDDVGPVSVFFKVLWIAFIGMDFFDFVIGEFFGWKEVDFFHFNDSWGKPVFPFADFALKDKFIGATVSDKERAFARDLTVESITIPLVNKSGVDFF
jgi:hypothetical protein